jgi:hypothetical protein
MSREVVVALKARPYQRSVIDFFRQGGQHAFEVWHRRAGKDRVATFIESELAMKRVGLYWHCLPEYKHARRVIWDNITRDGKKLIDVNFPPEMVARTHATEMKLELVNGSIWQLVGADNFNSLVGANPVHVTFSEFAITHPQAREFVRPILAENGGSELLITTPRGYNHAWKLWQTAQADKRWHTSMVTVDDSRIIPPDVLEAERAEMPDELFRQEYYCDFSAANVGSIFGRLLEEAQRDGRIVALPYTEDRVDGDVVVSSDIGYRDKAAWWWWRLLRGGAELFDYEEGSGMDAEEWIDRLETKPRADVLLLPHDARVKTFQSRRSTVETFLKSNVAGKVIVNAQRKKHDSINAGRQVLKRVRIDPERCGDGLEALRNYHFKYDPEQRCFSAEPEHDWSSHGADAFMEGAAYLQSLQKTERKVETPRLRTIQHMVLDDLHSDHLNHMANRRVS